MAVKIGSLLISLGLESGAFKSGLGAAEKELKAATRRIQKSGESMKGIGQSLSLGVTLPLAALGRSAVKAALESQDALGQVNATLASVGSAAGKTAADLAKLADSGMRQSLFDDDEILRKVTTSLLTFDKISGQTFDRAQQAALNLSQKFGKDLQSSALMVGKALQNPVRGLTALEKAGITFTDQQKDQIKAMVAVGDAAGAQAIVLGQLDKKLDDSAAAARKANPFAALSQSMNEFQEKVGAVLLKILPNIAKALERVLNAFSSLSPGMQQAVVVAGIFAAALGPVLVVLGSLVSLTAPFTAALGLIGGSSGVLAAMGAGATGLLAALGPILIPLAAIAAVGALIYANWDKIGPVLSELGGAFENAVGPEVTALVSELRTTLVALWDGPLGAALRTVVSALGDLLAMQLKVFGPVVIGAIKIVIGAFKTVFGMIGDGIRLVGALITGDWAGAWAAAVSLIRRPLAFIGDLVGRMVNAIGDWLGPKLNAIWDWVTAKIETVKKAFFGLYDAVVGNSYIPDMVDGIAAQMARLDAVLVAPAVQATDVAGAAFRDLADKVRPLLDELFPEAARQLKFEIDSKSLTAATSAGVLTPGQGAEAQARLLATRFPEIAAAVDGIGAMFGGAWSAIEDGAVDAFAQVGTLAVKSADKMKVSFVDAAHSILGALDSLAGSIRGGGFFDIVDSVLGLLTQLGSLGLFGSKIATNINTAKIPAYAGGTGFHPGGLALVGESGPELVRLPRGAGVNTASETRGMLGGSRTRIEVVPSQYFDVRVQENISAAAPGIAAAGGEVGIRRMAYRQSRRVG